MPMERECEILKRKLLPSGAVLLELAAGDMVTKTCTGPGQFVHIQCGEGRLLRRPISVCAWTEDTFTIVFEVRGEGTGWLAERKPGEHLNVLGFLGHGFQMTPGGKYLLVGGGIGVPPMLGCALNVPGSIAVLGFRSKEKAILTEEFQAACATVKVATDDGTLGHHGYVDEVVRDIIDKEKGFTSILACGPRPMLKKVAQVAAEHGVPCQVSMEERMGCGVGACLVCACDMADGTRKHVCRSGPVFSAEEVDWNA